MSLRLSEAIRLGAMLKPQAFGTSYNGVGTCAAGAALDAVCALRRMELLDIAEEQGWDIDCFQNAVCPECGSPSDYSRSKTIPHLNDDHRWTREAIADWIETLEAPQVPSERPRASTADGLQATHALVAVTK